NLVHSLIRDLQYNGSLQCSVLHHRQESFPHSTVSEMDIPLESALQPGLTPLTPKEHRKISSLASQLSRHVMLPKELAKQVPKTHLMSEEEWRRLGVQQSLGWVHYMIHEPEPHILLFRRPLPKDQQK
ncbi:unnamed protein product, partial [Staurois parvus]